MFKKRAQFGQSRKKKRKQSDDEEGEEERHDDEQQAGHSAGEEGGASARVRKEKDKKKGKRKKGAPPGSKMLSFGDEEGDSDLQVLKKVANPSLSSLHRTRAENEEQGASSSAGGMYSAESLRALKEASFSYGGGHVPVYTPAEDEGAIVADEDASVVQSDIGAGIPDAQSIQRAREKRERLRKQGDYIPLEGEEPKDDDHEDEEDDDDGGDLLADPSDAPSDERVAMKGGATPRAARKRAEVEAALADGDDFYRGDGELQRLEAQHVRGAMTGAVPTGRNSLALRDTFALEAGGLRGQSQRQSLLKEIRIDDVCRTLRSSLRRQEEQLGKNRRELVTNGEASKLTVADVEVLNSKLRAVEPKYQFFQELWLYVDSMTDCLDSKMDLIEECEVQLLELEKSEAEAAAAHRWVMLDDLADSLVAPGTKAQTPNALSGNDNGRGDLDEFGRDRSHTTKTMLTAGAAKRAEERRAMIGGLKATDCEFDSDEEGRQADKATDEHERVRMERAEILQAASVIFADASEEFSTVAAVAARMAEWKCKQPRSYHDTYVSINLFKIFAPFARLDMLSWHPSDGCIDGLAQQSWFAALENYGMDGNGTSENGRGSGSRSEPATEIAADDPDLDLIPGLVEKVVLPRLLAWLRNGWDPMSRRSTDVAFQCVSELVEVYVTVEKPAMTALLATVLNRLQSSGDRIRIPLGTAAGASCGTDHVDENSEVSRGAISNYLFNRATGFVRNAVLWSGLLAAGPLEAVVANVVGNHLCPLLACTLTTPLERSGEEWLPKLQRLVDSLIPASTPAAGAGATWVASTNMLRHVVRAAVTGSPRAQMLLPEERLIYEQLAARLP